MTVSTAIKTLLAAAAATVTPVPLVRAGEPAIPGAPMLVYWYVGFPMWEANTFTFTQRMSRWGIRAYWPMTPTLQPAEDEDVEAWLEAVTLAVEGQFWGHVSLMGASTGEGIHLSDATAGWIKADSDGSNYRCVEWELDAYLSNVSSIAD